MAAGIIDFKVEQGTTFTTTITLQTTNTTAWDLSEYSVRGQIRETASSIEKIADFYCTIVEPLEGKIKITLSPEKTSSIKLNGKSYSSLTKYVYDIEIYKVLEGGSEEVHRVLNGYVFISPEVTK